MYFKLHQYFIELHLQSYNLGKNFFEFRTLDSESELEYVYRPRQTALSMASKDEQKFTSVQTMGVVLEKPTKDPQKNATLISKHFSVFRVSI